VIEAAMTDTVEGRESALLEWLAKEWKVEVMASDTEGA
jgi:hypothetical protein